VEVEAEGPKPSPEALSTLSATLPLLPSPSVALCTGSPSRERAAVLEPFDVVVASETELAPLLETAQQTPLASMALVQLLRHSARTGIDDGLFAESLVYSTLQGGPEFRRWLETRSAPSEKGANPEPAVLVRRSGERLELTLNRPDKRNAFSAEMRDALVEGLRVAASDPTITEVLLTGTGPSFCAGGDLDEFGSLPDPATAHGVRSTRSPARWMAACGARVRVEVQGACVGAGIELPAFARRVVASGDALFQLPEISMGLVPGAGGTVSLPRRIGRQRTAYLALSGARIDADTALSWGVVDELVA
jgi:hypothetical protein